LGRVSAFLRMSRPLPLLAAIMAYGLGMSMAHYELGRMEWDLALFGLTILVSATLMAHYANEYADVDTDTITRRTFYSGGSGVLPSGELRPHTALVAAIGFLVISITLTALGILTGAIEPVVVSIVALGLLGGWFYSMPPLMVERTLWGEIDNSLLGGILMPLLAFSCITGGVEPWAVLACIPVFMVVLANLVGVHWLDRETDQAVGKRTLVVFLGRKTIIFHRVTMAFVYISLLSLWGWALPWEAVVMGMLTLPLGLIASLRFEALAPRGVSSIAMGALMVTMAIGLLVAT
jgi:1,4-dihydroxy-2-naphthoate octaprenyltransferase